MMNIDPGISDKSQPALADSLILASAPRPYGTYLSIRHGAVVSMQGQKPDTVYLIENGFVVSKKILRDGRQLTTAISVPGDVVNHEAFTIGAVFSTAYALGETKVLTVPLKQFGTLINNDPVYQKLFWRFVAYQGLLAREWMVRVGRLTATEKTAHFICEMFWRTELAGHTEGDFCNFALKQSEWADALGLSVVQQNRSLQTLRAQGLIEWSTKGFRIKDRARLKGLANFDSGYLAAALPIDIEATALSAAFKRW